MKIPAEVMISIAFAKAPGWLGQCKHTTSAGIFIEYMYAFSQGDAANVIIRPDDVNKCAEVLKANKLELIAASDLYKL